LIRIAHTHTFASLKTPPPGLSSIGDISLKFDGQALVENKYYQTGIISKLEFLKAAYNNNLDFLKVNLYF